MKILRVAILVTVFTIPANATAGMKRAELMKGLEAMIKKIDGGQLSNEEEKYAFAAAAYMQGFADAVNTCVSIQNLPYCIPNDTPPDQIVRSLLKVMKKEKGLPHMQLIFVYKSLMSKAFPCRK